MVFAWSVMKRKDQHLFQSNAFDNKRQSVAPKPPCLLKAVSNVGAFAGSGMRNNTCALGQPIHSKCALGQDVLRFLGCPQERTRLQNTLQIYLPTNPGLNAQRELNNTIQGNLDFERNRCIMAHNLPTPSGIPGASAFLEI